MSDSISPPILGNAGIPAPSQLLEEDRHPELPSPSKSTDFPGTGRAATMGADHRWPPAPPLQNLPSARVSFCVPIQLGFETAVLHPFRQGHHTAGALPGSGAHPPLAGERPGFQ